MSIFVVGDIQGCYKPLRKLLKKAAFNPKKDTLWAVGDLIGRGTQAKKTLDYLISLGNHFHTVLGNHDLHFLAVSLGIRPNKRSDKFDALLDSDNLAEYQHWLRHKPLAASIGKGMMISHAGLYPGWSIKQALALSEEVQERLCSDQWQTFLAQMYNNEPASWNDNLQGDERLRFIVNAMTRMRFVHKDRRLNFDNKSSPNQQLKDLYPWFLHPSMQLKPKQRVLFGHWAALQGQTKNKQFIGLDTGCVWGGKMTMIKIGSLKRISIIA